MQQQKTQLKQMQQTTQSTKQMQPVATITAAATDHNIKSRCSQINAIAAAADDATKSRREIDQTQ
jgi:spore germination protein GerM